jgi:hypothetical protein
LWTPSAYRTSLYLLNPKSIYRIVDLVYVYIIIICY